MPQSSAQLRNGQFIASTVMRQLGVSVAAAIQNTATEGLARLPEFAQVLVTAIEGDMRKADRSGINHELATGAAEAVLVAFDSRNPNRETPAYRQSASPWPRRVGALRSLLSNIEAMTAGTTRTRIAFFNEEEAAAEASYWIRLNYGAGPSHGKNPKAYEVAIDGHQLFVLQLPNRAQPPVKLPGGFWKGPGQREFWPASMVPKDERVGARWQKPREVSIQATQFLDAGNLYISRQLGPKYSTFIRKAAGESRSRGAIEARLGRPIRDIVDIRRTQPKFTGGRISSTY